MQVYLIQCLPKDASYFEPKIQLLNDWVKYFDSNYFVASTLNALELYEYLTEENPQKSLLVIEVNTENYYGRLNAKVWDMLTKYKKQ